MTDITARLIAWAQRLRDYVKGTYPSWWVILKGMVYHTNGQGPSVTKGAYGFVCVIMGVSVLLMTFTFCWVYKSTQKADYTFATALGVVGGLFMGFATSAQKKKCTQIMESLGATPQVPDPTSSKETTDEDPAAKV